MIKWGSPSGLPHFFTKPNPIMNELDWINAKIFAVEKAEEKAKAEQTKLIAKKMKENEIPVQTIVECTGLSVEEISAL